MMNTFSFQIRGSLFPVQRTAWHVQKRGLPAFPVEFAYFRRALEVHQKQRSENDPGFCGRVSMTCLNQNLQNIFSRKICLSQRWPLKKFACRHNQSEALDLTDLEECATKTFNVVLAEAKSGALCAMVEFSQKVYNLDLLSIGCVLWFILQFTFTLFSLCALRDSTLTDVKPPRRIKPTLFHLFIPL